MLTLLDEQKAKMDRLAIASLVQIETRQHFLLVFRTAFSKTDILLVRDYFVSTIHYLLKPSLPELISKFTDDAATGLTFALELLAFVAVGSRQQVGEKEHYILH